MIILLITAFAFDSKAQVVFPPDFEQTVLRDYNELTHVDEPFEVYLSMRRVAFVEKYNISNGLAAVYTGCVMNNTPCGNGDFESGLNTSEWDGGYGTITNYPNSLTQGFSALNLPLGDANARHTIVSTGNDPITGVSMVAPGGSTRALRLGNTAVNGNMELISKRFTVTSNQTILSFQFATVMQDPSHVPNNQPTFWVRVIDCNTGQELTNVCNLGNNSNSVIANQNNPFFSVTQYQGRTIVYTQWMCAQINLSAHVGRTVSIQFLNRDCTQLGHFGYTYLDNLCVATNCNTGNVILARKPDCGPGQACFSYSLPQINGITGSTQISLQLLQNGNVLQTLNSPTLTSGNQYCFNITPLSIPGINTSLEGYDFVATANFAISGFTLAPIVVGNPPAGQTSGLNNDALISCIPQCCPGRNMIKNPGFEQGNQSFSSQYTYQPTIAANSVSTGRYNVMTSAQGLTVSPTWNVNCASNGNHLFVNGATGLSGSRTAWYQVVNVERGKNYKFCADMKNLPQCGFDVKPRVNVLFSVPGFNINNQVINVPSGACNWLSVNQVITTPAGTGTFSMSITITLDETGIGDGNDLAIDNITLVEISQTPLTEVLFNLSFINITGTTFGLSANPLSPLGRDCGYYWEVSEVDANYNTIPGTAVYNPSQWWVPNPNTFNGYVGTSTLIGNNPGIFQLNRRYRVVYGRWCACSAWNSYAIILDPMNFNGSPGSIRIIKDDKYLVNPSLITEAMSLGYNRAGEEARQSGETTFEKKQETIADAPVSLQIFPNPVDEQLTVMLPAKTERGQLIVFNLLGEQIQTVAVEANATRKIIETGGLASGTYIIKFKSSKGNFIAIEKFVKLKK